MIEQLEEGIRQFCQRRQEVDPFSYEPELSPGAWAFFALKQVALVSGSVAAHLVVEISLVRNTRDYDELFGNGVVADICNNVEAEAEQAFIEFARKSEPMQRFSEFVYWSGLTEAGRERFVQYYPNFDAIRRKYEGNR